MLSRTVQSLVHRKMENFENKLWPLIYDQANHGRHEQELSFYSAELSSCSGPILEVACGTGMILLPMFVKGLDIYGFDISLEMLDLLFAKAKNKGNLDIHERVTQQNMVDFHYDKKFEAIFIPSRSFTHLLTQEEQIACLKNIHDHLQDGGRFLLNFSTPSLKALLRHAEPNQEFIPYGIFQHPDTREKIEVSFKQNNNLSEQIHYMTWRFSFGGEVRETKMRVRWIYKNEFQVLLRFTGFKISALYGDFHKSSYQGDGEMIWVLEKDST